MTDRGAIPGPNRILLPRITKRYDEMQKMPILIPRFDKKYGEMQKMPILIPRINRTYYEKQKDQMQLRRKAESMDL
jgi:hypothetical protein